MKKFKHYTLLEDDGKTSEYYHVLKIVNHIVVRESEEVLKKWIDTVTDEHPFRTDEGYGNPLARVIREKYHILKRGYDGFERLGEITDNVKHVEVVVVPDYGDGNKQLLDMMFCWYEDGKFSPNPRWTEDERLEMAKRYYCHKTLPLGFDRQDYIESIHSEDGWNKLSPYLTRDEFDTLIARFRAHEEIPEKAEETYKWVMSLPEDLSIQMRFVFATAATTRTCSIDGVVSSDLIKKNKNMYFTGPYVLTDLQEQVDRSKRAMYWWGTLKGTRLEKCALSEIAQLYHETEREDEARDLYIEIRKTQKLNDYEKQVVDDKIRYINAGRKKYKEIVDLYQKRKFDEGILAAEKWLSEFDGKVGEKFVVNIKDARLQCIDAKKFFKERDIEKV